ENLLKAPNSQYIFGTDGLGRDMRFRIIKALYNSLITGIKGSLISISIGLFIFILFKKFIWNIINIWIVFPFNMFILLLILLFSDFHNFYLISGIVFSINILVFLKSLNFKLSNNDKFSVFFTMFFHILGLIILAEVTLGYLGFTFMQPEPSFGNILLQARENILSSWWLIFIPGIFLIFLNFIIMYFELYFKKNIKNFKEKYF
ncbi:MAG: hypothetical protein M0Q02_03130, partial [Candidatus Muirbacterium halophilum]|nr:hypothetical protein [Candidatus Muirbacterium halophilum]